MKARFAALGHPPSPFFLLGALLLGPGVRAETVPAVVGGPAAAEAAARVDAPIAEVTVFSDRARVRRRGQIALPAGGGARLLRLPDLPGAVSLTTVRLSATGGRVLRVEAAPIEQERLSIAQAEKLLGELEAASDRLAELEDQGRIDDWEVSLLGDLVPAPPVAEEKREGRKALVPDVGAWSKALDFLDGRATAARGRLARLAEERREATALRDRLRADVKNLDRGGFSQRKVQVSAVIEAAGRSGPVALELEYFIAGARWKPTYDLHYAAARGELRVETAAVVEQATGEAWENAALAFSTAIPGAAIELPELATWTLGERGEFVPRPRARATPQPIAPPPVPAQPSPAAAAARDAAAAIRERLASAIRADADREIIQALPAGETGKRGKKRKPSDALGDGIGRGEIRAPAGGMPAPAAAPESAPSMPVAASAPPPAPYEGRKRKKSYSRESDGEKESLESLDEDDSSSSLADTVKSIFGSKRDSPTSTVQLALDDAGPPRRGARLTDPDLPAVSGGGLDYVYRAPGAAQVPSTGVQIRVPLASQTFRAATFHQATPALAPTAFLRARVRNDGKRPLLRGPAAIFSDGEFLGQGQIQTTGPGGDMELPLGADPDIRLVRQVVPATKTTGLIMKSDETTYDVQIQIGNYKRRPAVIEIVDQVPKSVNAKVEIKVLGTSPAVLAAPDALGIVRWRVELPAGATRTVYLRYQIVRPKDWRLYQR